LNANSKSPLIIGHRGAASVAPENTIAAFKRAMDDGADGIEFDVRLSRDAVPVVIHDATLKRTAALPNAVSSLTASELEKVDVGSWFNRRFPTRARNDYAKERVPTLERTFAKVRDLRGPLYVELKSDGVADAALVTAVTALVTEFEFRDRVIVESFTLENIQLVKRIDARIKTVALFEPKRAPLSLVSGKRLIRRAIAVGADELALHRSSVNQRLALLAKQAGLSVVVWTVDTPSWIARAGALGVNALITNRPGELVRARASARD
jgi:glycerophosphoryl diester phosphodiesterase